MNGFATPAARRGAAVFATAALHAAVVLPLLGLRVPAPAPQTVLVGVQIAAPPAPAPVLAPQPPVPPTPQPSPRTTAMPIASARSSAPTTVAATATPIAEPAVPTAPVAAAPAAAPAVTASAGDEATPPDFRAAYLDNPRPPYPPLSRRLREQGRIRLRVHVTPEGRADAVQIVAGSDFERLDLAARNAVQDWRFVPARQRGTAIAAWVEVPIQFELEP